MKRILAIGTLLAYVTLNAEAQPVCTADPNCSFDSLLCASNRSPACAGVPYTNVLTMAVPASFTDPSTGNTVPVKNIKINSITGFPQGITYACNPSNCTVNGGSRGCIKISGTANTPGTYTTVTSIRVTVIYGTCPFCIEIPFDTVVNGTFVVQAKDCAGVCGGTAAIDNCGRCAGGTTGISPNCDDGVPCTKDVCTGQTGCTNTDTCCVQQNINLASGWNTISGYVIPDNPSMPAVFQNINSNIIIVKNNTGQTYIPSLNINTIGNWDYKQGYKAKTSAASVLTIGCIKANPSTPINLNLGWNMVSYLRTTPMNISTALASLGSNIIIVKNNAGQTYIPDLNVNTIGNMQPGQGYQIKMRAPAQLAYPQ